MNDKPKIGSFVRMMARWYGVTPEQYAAEHGGEPEGLILEPGEDEPVQWLQDRVRRSPGGDLVLVEGPDGFKALRLLGRWTDTPTIKLTFGDAEQFVDVTEQFERFTLAREARLAIAGEQRLVVNATPGRELVWVLASDGFSSVRLHGKWGATGFTVGDLSTDPDLDPVTDPVEALKLANEARIAMAGAQDGP